MIPDDFVGELPRSVAPGRACGKTPTRLLFFLRCVVGVLSRRRVLHFDGGGGHLVVDGDLAADGELALDLGGAAGDFELLVAFHDGDDRVGQGGDISGHLIGGLGAGTESESKEKQGEEDFFHTAGNEEETAVEFNAGFSRARARRARARNACGWLAPSSAERTAAGHGGVDGKTRRFAEDRAQGARRVRGIDQAGELGDEIGRREGQAASVLGATVAALATHIAGAEDQMWRREISIELTLRDEDTQVLNSSNRQMDFQMVRGSWNATTYQDP